MAVALSGAEAVEGFAAQALRAAAVASEAARAAREAAYAPLGRCSGRKAKRGD